VRSGKPESAQRQILGRGPALDVWNTLWRLCVRYLIPGLLIFYSIRSLID